MDINWSCTDAWVSLVFDKPVKALSSAILGGGLGCVQSFLNMRVDENFKGAEKDFPPPRQTLSEVIRSINLPEPASGMMTAASMNSFRYSFRTREDISVFCFLTAGLSNALAAGDAGEFLPGQMYSGSGNSRTGTINMAVGTDCPLSDAALTEALLITTEAKSSVLFELGVKSINSERIATGTGTDSAFIFCRQPEASGPFEEFCGKHTVLGEMFAAVVREALFDSVKNDAVFSSR